MYEASSFVEKNCKVEVEVVKNLIRLTDKVVQVGAKCTLVLRKRRSTSVLASSVCTIVSSMTIFSSAKDLRQHSLQS